MSLETAQYIHQLNPANPSGADRLKEGDDHLRMIKAVLRATFPGIQGPLDSSITHTFLNGIADFLVKPGTVAMWWGAEEDVPEGWAICNGASVPKSDGSGNITTPDLRDRVPVGASATHASGEAYGQTSRTVTSTVAGGHKHTGTATTAGAHNHSGETGQTALTEAQMPAHRHKNGVADNNSNEVFVYGFTSSGGSFAGIDADPGHPGVYQGFTETVGGGQAHTHSITESGAHAHPLDIATVDGHSHQATVDVTQPSLALHFIIKV